MIQEIGRQTDRGIRDSVQGLWSQPQLESIRDSFLIDELQTLVSTLLVGGETRWRRRPGESRLVNLGWKDARHVGVNAKQLRWRLHAHQIDHYCAPVAALRDKLRISEALHQRDPGACDTIRAPTGRARFA